MAAPATVFTDPELWPGPPDQLLRPNSVPPLRDPDAALRRALRSPLGCAPLPELAAHARRVAVVLPDSTRPSTPWVPMLGQVLDVLFEAGRRPEEITLVIGNGMHPRKGPEALGLGEKLRRGCAVVDHDARDASQLSDLGRVPGLGLRFFRTASRRLLADLTRHASSSARSAWRSLVRLEADAPLRGLCQASPLRFLLAGVASGGARVRMNRAVAEADLVIGLSRVKPHPLTGYSGGAKAIYPGAGDFWSLSRNHLRQVHGDSRPGEVEHNLLRLGLEAAVSLLSDPFVVNAVTDGQGRWCEVTAGEPVASHRAALPVARAIAEVRAAPSDVVVFSNSEQAGLDLYQFSKSLLQPAQLLRSGGTAIAVAPLPLGRNGAGPPGVSVALGQGVYYGMGIRPFLATGIRFFLVAPRAREIARGTPYRGFEHLDDALAEAGRGRRSAHVTHIPDLDSVIPVLG